MLNLSCFSVNEDRANQGKRQWEVMKLILIRARFLESKLYEIKDSFVVIECPTVRYNETDIRLGVSIGPYGEREYCPSEAK